MRNLASYVLAAFVSVACAVDAPAAPGDIDPTFGVGGVARVDLGYFDSASDLAIQPDQKILAAGTVSDSGRNVFVLRLLANGSLDPGFGAGGIVMPNRFHQIAPQLAL